MSAASAQDKPQNVASLSGWTVVEGANALTDAKTVQVGDRSGGVNLFCEQGKGPRVVLRDGRYRVGLRTAGRYRFDENDPVYMDLYVADSGRFVWSDSGTYQRFRDGLLRGARLRYLVQHGGTRDISLQGSTAAVEEFLSKCDAIGASS